MGTPSPNEQEVFDRVKRAIEKLLRTANRDIKAQMRRDTNIYADLGIDSVEVMDLLGLIEAEFGVSLDIEKAVNKQTVGDISDFVSIHLQGGV